MSDLVGNPEDRFSHNEAQIKEAQFQTVVPGHARSAVGNLNFEEAMQKHKE